MTYDNWKQSTPDHFDSNEDEDFENCNNCGNDYIREESNSDFKKSFCSRNCEHLFFEERPFKEIG